MYDKIKAAADCIVEAAAGSIDVAIVLGSGLSDATAFMNVETRVSYADIPGFFKPTVAGHAGELIIGRVGNKRVAAMRGRFHMYEGHAPSDVVLPIRALIMAGAKNVILTNAAGGINMNFRPGDLMLITDHINMTGANPLIGANDERLGTRFPDMTRAYDRTLCRVAQTCADRLGIELRRGVYAWMSGPSYETPAEIRMLRIIGADAVGMSTVPEVIAARHMGASVMGISCITNMAAGVYDIPLSHEEVGLVAGKAAVNFLKLISAIIKAI